MSLFSLACTLCVVTANFSFFLQEISQINTHQPTHLSFYSQLSVNNLLGKPIE